MSSNARPVTARSAKARRAIPSLPAVELKGERPEPTVGSYWPFATTLWDYINRAMPFPSPHALNADDVYAMTAYILNLNNIVG